MTAINNAYISALLADSSYVEKNINGKTGQDLIDALSGRMTPELAKFIGENFTVKAQASGYASSFEATVWQGNAGTPYAGQVYVSMRGTQGLTDIFDTDLDLARSGIAHNQLADMVNWWLRETTLPNAMAKQICFNPILGAENNIIGYQLVEKSSVQGTGNLANIAGSITAVNGHSLGGYLATAFARLFSNQASPMDINTFNSAGYSRPNAEYIETTFNQIAQIIGPGVGLSNFSAAQDNFFAENGINVTTNTWDPLGFQQYGTRIALYQEHITGPISNHSMYKLTDLLALADALAQLDPTFNEVVERNGQLELVKLNDVLRTGSAQMSASYESVLDALRV